MTVVLQNGALFGFRLHSNVRILLVFLCVSWAALSV